MSRGIAFRWIYLSFVCFLDSCFCCKVHLCIFELTNFCLKKSCCFFLGRYRRRIALSSLLGSRLNKSKRGSQESSPLFSSSFFQSEEEDDPLFCVFSPHTRKTTVEVTIQKLRGKGAKEALEGKKQVLQALQRFGVGISKPLTHTTYYLSLILL